MIVKIPNPYWKGCDNHKINEIIDKLNELEAKVTEQESGKGEQN